jgi:hypothetical protein
MVVTWTPSANDALPFVELMQSYGFDWVWVDGDRGAAFHTLFRRRNGVVPPRFVDPFARDGSFRPLAFVVTELLEPDAGATRLRWRDRPSRDVVAAFRNRLPRTTALGGVGAVGARARAGLAAGLAVTAAAATAVGALVVGSGVDRSTPAALSGKAATARPAALPRNGVLVHGRSLAGVRLGDTATTVRSRWGNDFTVCKGCKTRTWLYLYASGDPVGAGVKFREGKVTAIFTLGMTLGWKSTDGLRVGELIDSNNPNDPGSWKTCAGYSARSVPSGDSVTSILTVGYAVYGFALTRPTETVCN